MTRPTPRPAIPPLLKHMNERTVLEAIREGAPISRAEISRRAGISKPTVSLALQSLLKAGLVRETEPDPGRPSYGAVYFEPAADAAFVLGFDLGAHFLRGAACDLAGEVRAREDVELPSTDAGTAIATIAAVSALAADLGVTGSSDARAVFAAARNGDRPAREVVEETARRIALHVAPIAAVADIGLVVLGGGIGANGDLLLEPVRALLAEWMPYPPRVEVSSLGEAAVLTGALAVGLHSALDSVFLNRAGAQVSGSARVS